MGSIASKVLAASAGRDRVMDAVKALALLLVIAGHSLAWTVTGSGSVINTLDAVPYMFPLTWVLQILPLFFLLAGAGLTRLAAARDSRGYLVRLTRLSAPALPLIAVAMVLALIAGVFAGQDAGRAAGLLPVQLVWFLGVYLVLVAAAPLLVRFSGPLAIASSHCPGTGCSPAKKRYSRWWMTSQGGSATATPSWCPCCISRVGLMRARDLLPLAEGLSRRGWAMMTGLWVQVAVLIPVISFAQHLGRRMRDRGVDDTALVRAT